MTVQVDRADRADTAGSSRRDRQYEYETFGDRAMLLERNHQLRAVEQALRSAEASRGSVAAVAGPPGCGRSALLNAACESPAAAGCTVLRSDGAASEQKLTFGVVQQLFQPLLGVRSAARTDALFTGAAGVARAVLVDDPWSDEHLPDAAVLHALHALLLNACADRAVLLVVDDVQWADTASLTWLVYLAKRLRKARVLVLCATTPQLAYQDSMGVDPGGEPIGGPAERRTLLRELVDSAALVLEPAPLSAAAVRHMLGSQATDELVRICCETTGGRPAAVTEAVAALRAHAQGLVGQGPLDSAAARDRCQRALLRWRMGLLAGASTQVRQLVDAMTVLGEHAEAQTLRELADLDDIGYIAAMRSLDELGMLASSEPPRLVHTSLSSAVYAAMGREPRERFHLAAARALHAAGLPAGPVAEHLLLCGDPLSPWGVNVLRTAAAQAAERGAMSKAARLLQSAMLTATTDDRLRAQLTVDLAAAERDTDPLSCVQRVRNAVPRLEPGPERAAAVLLVPPVLSAGNAPMADLIGRVGDELAASDQAEFHPGLALRLEARARLLNLYGAAGGRSGPAPEPGFTQADVRVRELLRSGNVDTGPGRELLAVLAWESVLTGRLSAPGVAALCARVVSGEPADPAHVHTALSALVGAALEADAADYVEPWIDRAAAAAGPGAPAGVRAFLAGEQAVLLARTGRLERARKLGVRLLESADSAWPASRVLAASALATVALQSQDIGLAEALLNAPSPLAGRHSRMTRRMLRGMLAACSAESAEALEEFLEVGRELSAAGWIDTGGPPWRTWAAMLRERLGEHDRAVELAEAELRAARAWGGPNRIGCALRLLGMLTPGEERLRLLREAVSVHRRSADRLELARSAVMLGRVLRAEGLPGAAQLLATAEQLARNCDASWPEGGEGELLGPVPRLLRSGRDRLSPAEDAVVDLAQRGLSNAQIAEELSVTRRAVEKHLTSVYRKLGVSGRAALLAELAVAAPNLDERTRPHPPNYFP